MTLNAYTIYFSGSMILEAETEEHAEFGAKYLLDEIAFQYTIDEVVE